MKLVFIHGSGMNSVVWQQQLAYFDNAEALDLPGHPSGEIVENIDGYVSFIQTYLDKMDQEIVIVGHSLGGALALKIAQLPNANLLKGMVLIGSGARLKVMPMILEALAKSAADDNELPPLMYSMAQEIEEPLRSEIASVMKDNGASVMLNDLSICDCFDIMEDLSSITIPTLVIVGEKDQMTPPKYADYMVKSMPNAKLEIIEGGTHMVFAEKAERVNSSIEAFCRGLV